MHRRKFNRSVKKHEDCAYLSDQSRCNAEIGWIYVILNCKVIIPTKYLSDKEYNSRYSPHISYNNQIIKIKRNAGCQTSEKCKSYHVYKKPKKKIESSKKRSIAYFSTNIPSSKDIKTIIPTRQPLVEHAET